VSDQKPTCWERFQAGVTLLVFIGFILAVLRGSNITLFLGLALLVMSVWHYPRTIRALVLLVKIVWSLGHVVLFPVRLVLGGFAPRRF
jgi:hypothetical protein